MSDLIPLEILFGDPECAQPRLSPNGARLAFLAPLAGISNVWVGHVGRRDHHPVTSATDRPIRTCQWGQDNEHVLYLQDRDGDENWHLHTVDLLTGAVRDLTPFEGVQVQLLSKRNPYLPNSLLIAMNRDDPAAHDVYHVNLATGDLRLATRNPGNVAHWIPDRRLEVRACMVGLPDGGYDLMVIRPGSRRWDRMVRWEPEDGLFSEPVGFSEDGNNVYLRDSRGSNTTRLVRLDLRSSKHEVLAEDPDYDVGEILVNERTFQPEAAAFTRARVEWKLLDPAITTDFETVAATQQGNLAFESRDDRDRTWLVSFAADDGPITYYAFDRATKRTRHLFDHQSELRRYRLAPIESISFRSRDNLTIHGYVTFPPGKPRHDLPTVLSVHGGPWERDVWGFNPEVQWLANRGYLCLQVNFRGSTGYGKDFFNAGNLEWGGKMHNDLIDGVEWAVARGYADARRIAIFGGSYGGYAALAGAAFTPGVFCCAVDLCGPSDLNSLIRSIPPYWSVFRATLFQRVGNPETDANFLDSRSPLSRVDQIRIPILVGQGVNDPRVPVMEAEQIVDALRRKGIDHEYLLFEDEGHELTRPTNRLKFFRRAEQFLARHLGGAAERTE